METPSDDLGFDYVPTLPVAISQVGSRYLLFDIKIATYLRREQNICGTTIGTLPLSPSQNLFLGVPIEIMPEEAQLLVEKGIGFIMDDAKAHDLAVRAADRGRRDEYLAKAQRQSRQVELLRSKEKEQGRKRALDKQARKAAPSSNSSNRGQRQGSLLNFDDNDATEVSNVDDGQEEVAPSNGLPASAQTDDSPVKILPVTTLSNTYYVTPSTSRLLLPDQNPTATSPTINNLPASYSLYRHLHSRGFFMTPGLRFGCQYTVYPGDPLRFHSHFLAVGTQWDEEIDLMDVVGGGRLGTGVKKGFLLGGESPAGDVRTFSVEWAAM